MTKQSLFRDSATLTALGFALVLCGCEDNVMPVQEAEAATGNWEPAPMLGSDAGIDGMQGTAGNQASDGQGPDGAGRSYVNLAPTLGAPFDPAAATALNPAAPEGWVYHAVEGASCRDGSPMGVFVRDTGGSQLLIYLEGGGACTTPGFCNYNPANVDTMLSGDGSTVIGSTFGVVPGRQQPGAYEAGALRGIFDETNAANPYKGWNMVYVPYCTGDVHFGTNENAMVPGVPTPQKMVGHLNTKLIVGRAVPTFKERVDQVVVTGASAGSFGAALNFSMIQDAFGEVPVHAVLDSGVPFTDEFWPACLQQSWRDLFGLDAALPPDCEECFQQDGGGLIGLADFLIDKHPGSRLAVVSALQDEVIRLFFAPSMDNCALIETADPVALTTGQLFGGGIYPAEDYEAALLTLRDNYEGTGRFATYFLGDLNITMHQHTFRQRFYEAGSGGKSIADFTTKFLAGEMLQVSP